MTVIFELRLKDYPHSLIEVAMDNITTIPRQGETVLFKKDIKVYPEDQEILNKVSMTEFVVTKVEWIYNDTPNVTIICSE